MPNLRNRFPARRRFLKQSAALTASASLAVPVLALAHGTPPVDAAADGRDSTETAGAQSTAAGAGVRADRAAADTPPPARSRLTLRARKA